ncbi:methyltransferase domain-containing protein [Thermoleptolyngbya sichuanensis XZ-Cy5]|uniref:methyltransferase domain-containing protein n=1 Tax=Thermoleptolyngbya sichuanensis TaxID=2885951 RepID=UPI00240CFE4D|nr:methyltransferase domain-containing protein [Thermoleptolyngbya sichuanensis]MDG2615202.1 methyltransferase domain-containing protein [Thermoleptolyngbya sichuanensis XZ-Cy5]
MPKTLQQQIQTFYDASSGLWEQVWGEHMHHGYYGPAGTERKERRQAQIDLIEELLHWGGVSKATAILDVGCGIGGSSLYLAEKFGAAATGITLSPVQARRATERAAAAGLDDRTQFQVADALKMPFADGRFDLVWSMESGEHMPDKLQFLKECHRVLKPGGTFLMATWCHRPIDKSLLTQEEQAHLEKIYRVYRLPYVISLAEYEAIAHNLGYQNLRTADWSPAVAPFWDEVVRSAISPAAVVGLLRAGWGAMQAALSMGLMQSGYRRGLVRFGVLAGVKE